MPGHGRPRVCCFDVQEQSPFFNKRRPCPACAHCTGLPELLESLNRVQCVFPVAGEFILCWKARQYGPYAVNINSRGFD